MSDFIIVNDNLYHHGVKGQKWGVRRYQNKDGSLTKLGKVRSQHYQNKMNKQADKAKSRDKLLRERTIPAGTKMYRTSTNKNEHQEGEIYVTYLDVDRNMYKGGGIRLRDKSTESYEYEYTLKEDLKIPSRKKQYEIVNQVVKSNKKYLFEALKANIDILYPEDDDDYGYREDLGNIETYVNKCMEKWGDRTPEQAAFTVCSSLGLAPNVRKEIISTLKKQGYNAMVDEASVGGQNGFIKEGYDPLIVFDSRVLTKDKINDISAVEENTSFDKYRNWSMDLNYRNKKEVRWSAI